MLPKCWMQFVYTSKLNLPPLIKYVSIIKQLVVFQYCFGAVTGPCKGKDWDTVLPTTYALSGSIFHVVSHTFEKCNVCSLTKSIHFYATCPWQNYANLCNYDILCGLVVRVSGYRYRGLGFDSRCYQIFWVVVGLQRGPLSLVRSIEELLE